MILNENKGTNINTKNSKNILDNRRYNNNINYYHYNQKININQHDKFEPKKEYIQNQPKNIAIRNITRFIKSHKKIMEKANDKNRIIEKINNKELFNNIPDIKYSKNLKEYNNRNTFGCSNKLINSNIYKKSERDTNQDNHKYYEINMTTKKPITFYNNLSQNIFDTKFKESNFQEYHKVENNKDNNYFIKTLRKYDEENKGRKTMDNFKLPGEKNEKIKNEQTNNNNLKSMQGNIKTKSVLNNYNDVQNKYTLNNKLKETKTKDIRDSNLNKYSKTKIKLNDIVNQKTSSVLGKNIQKYEINVGRNDLNKLNQKNYNIHQNIYQKKIQNNDVIDKKVKSIFKNLKINNFNLYFENEIKNQKNVRKISKYELFYKKNIKSISLKIDRTELFFNKKVGKNRKLKVNKFYFDILSNNNERIKIFDILDREKVETLLIKGKEEKNIKKFSLSDKIKEIILNINQYNLSDEGIKLIIEELSSKIVMVKNKLIETRENQKSKKIKLNENNLKNENDNENKYCNKKDIKLKEKESIYQKLYGFKNEGNNCYLNSSLQLLTRIKDLKEEVFNFNDNFEDNDTQGKLIIEFRNILKKIENSNQDGLILNPSKLKRIMGNIDDKYNSNSQEDSNEFISNFISALLAETGNKEKKYKKLNIIDEYEKGAYEKFYKKFYLRKGDSFILNLFYGIIKVKTFCKKCGSINLIKFSAYNMLELPLVNLIVKYRNKDLTLDELLNDFFGEKKCEDSCINCNSDKLYSKTVVYTLPKYLIISFIRICDSKYFSNNIFYQKYLNIQSDFIKKESTYLLDCVIEHSGGLHFGHYTSLIPIDKNNNNWIRCSDEYCNEYTSGYESKNALMLLYKIA